MSESFTQPEAVKHILGHIVTPVTGAAMSFGMSFGNNTVPEAVLFVVAGAMLLFYGFNQTIEHADAKLNGDSARNSLTGDPR